MNCAENDKSYHGMTTMTSNACADPEGVGDWGSGNMHKSRDPTRKITKL